MASNSGLPIVMIFLFVGLMSAITVGVGSYTCTGGTWDYSNFDSELCTVWPEETQPRTGPSPDTGDAISDELTSSPGVIAVRCQDNTTITDCLATEGCTWDDDFAMCRLQRTEDDEEGCGIYTSELTCPTDCEWNASTGTCDNPPPCDLALTNVDSDGNPVCQRTPALYDKCIWDTNQYLCRDRVGCEKVLTSGVCNETEGCEWNGNYCQAKVPIESRPCSEQVFVKDSNSCYQNAERAIGMAWGFNDNSTARACQDKINQYRVKIKSSKNDYQTYKEFTIPGTAQQVGVQNIDEDFWGSTMKIIVDAYDVYDDRVLESGTITKDVDDTTDSGNCAEVGIDLTDMPVAPAPSSSTPTGPPPKDCVVNDSMYELGPCKRNNVVLDGGGSGSDASKRCGYGVRQLTLNRDALGFEAEENGGKCVDAKFSSELCVVPCPAEVKPEGCGWAAGGQWYAPTKSDGKVHCSSRPDASDDIGTCKNRDEQSAVYLEERLLIVDEIIGQVLKDKDGNDVTVTDEFGNETTAVKSISNCPAKSFRYTTCPDCKQDCEGYWVYAGDAKREVCSGGRGSTCEYVTKPLWKWVTAVPAVAGGGCECATYQECFGWGGDEAYLRWGDNAPYNNYPWSWSG